MNGNLALVLIFLIVGGCLAHSDYNAKSVEKEYIRAGYIEDCSGWDCKWVRGDK